AACDVFAGTRPAAAPRLPDKYSAIVPGRRLDRYGTARHDRRRSHQRAHGSRGGVMKSVVVHYKELALKGRNRPWFIARLVRNLRAVLADLDVGAVRPVMGRIEIELADRVTSDVSARASLLAEIRARVRRVFGIANSSHPGR